MKENPLDAFSLFYFINDRFFERCFTEAHAQAFGGVPNPRHAETHGFASYGTLQGATTLICVMDILLRIMHQQKALGVLQP